MGAEAAAARPARREHTRCPSGNPLGARARGKIPEPGGADQRGAGRRCRCARGAPVFAAPSRWLRDDALPRREPGTGRAAVSGAFRGAGPGCERNRLRARLCRASACWRAGSAAWWRWSCRRRAACRHCMASITGLALLLGFALPPLVSAGQGADAARAAARAGHAGRHGACRLCAGLRGDRRIDPVESAGCQAGRTGVRRFCRRDAGCRTDGVGAAAAFGGAQEHGVSWRFGMANLRRRVVGSIIQIIALGIGIMALLTLTLIRGDLLEAWQTSLPPDAPNRFIVNIQRDQVTPLAEFFAARGIARPAVFPMVRGRLVKINDRSVTPADYSDERARRLIDREFNLSWAHALRPDNRIVAGRWWRERTVAHRSVFGGRGHRRDARHPSRRQADLRCRGQHRHGDGDQPAQGRLGYLQRQFLRDRAAGAAR